MTRAENRKIIRVMSLSVLGICFVVGCQKAQYGETNPKGQPVAQTRSNAPGNAQPLPVNQSQAVGPGQVPPRATPSPTSSPDDSSKKQPQKENTTTSGDNAVEIQVSPSNDPVIWNEDDGGNSKPAPAVTEKPRECAMCYRSIVLQSSDPSKLTQKFVFPNDPENQNPIDADSVCAYVDGVQVGTQLNVSSNLVSISDYGQPLSKVEIYWCQLRNDGTSITDLGPAPAACLTDDATIFIKNFACAWLAPRTAKSIDQSPANSQPGNLPSGTQTSSN